ncbi:Hypothetical protein NTJ_06070 [Nesidiocoris tenuis]|uniref:Uncharacterized protein n=1 Tax=Nesidiocoris tenuis TaxID=355587 RepID=A0ABN7ALZ3_9HEMI|nr:Hypothetical protein NTJ_06070 [Nesidiocoris tenuis]
MSSAGLPYITIALAIHRPPPDEADFTQTLINGRVSLSLSARPVPRSALLAAAGLYLMPYLSGGKCASAD